jgi:hypothetical protein
MTAAAPPATVACPLKRAPGARRARTVRRKRLAGRAAANRPPVAARCGTEAEAVRVTLESTPVIVELDMALPRGAGRGQPTSASRSSRSLQGIWPQTDDSAVLAQFTAELEVLEAVAAPENPPISAPDYWRNETSGAAPGHRGVSAGRPDD